MNTPYEQPTDTGPTEPTGSGFPRWLKWGLLGALGVLVVGYGAIFLYANVINDSPDEFDETTLEERLAIGDETADEAAQEPAEEPAAETADETADEAAEEPAEEPAAETTAPGEEPAVETTAPAEQAAAVEEPAASSGDPLNFTLTDGSEAGYRVKEVLFGVDTEGVGRTDQIVGGITIEGTQVASGEFIVDVASITSDDGRRDNQFRGRIMSTDEFPEAVFTLTEPIELGTEPADGVEVTTTATGELTLRGVTNPVAFEVSAQQQNGRIGVLGSIPVVFADYSIANPSFGGITTEDEGLLEFVLVFEPT